MSVPVYKRSESKLDAHVGAIDLATYSIRAVYNEKILPKKSRFALGSRILDAVILIHNNVYKANNTYPTNAEEAKYRLDLQKETIREIKELAPTIGLAYNLYHLEGEKVDHWIGLVIKEEELLKKWHKSDKERYKKYFK